MTEPRNQLNVGRMARNGLLGLAPGTFMYVYAGYAAGEVAAAVTAEAPRGTEYYALLAVGLLATVAVTVLVARKAHQTLRRSEAVPAGDVHAGKGSGGEG